MINDKSLKELIEKGDMNGIQEWLAERVANAEMKKSQSDNAEISATLDGYASALYEIMDNLGMLD
jgi:hypothetical protein